MVFNAQNLAPWPLVWNGFIVISFVAEQLPNNSSNDCTTKDCSNQSRSSSTSLGTFGTRFRGSRCRRDPVVALTCFKVPPSISTIRRRAHGRCQGIISQDKVRLWWIQTSFRSNDRAIQFWKQSCLHYILQRQQLFDLIHSSDLVIVIKFPCGKGPSHSLFVGKDLASRKARAMAFPKAGICSLVEPIALSIVRESWQGRSNAVVNTQVES
mmetsp:Transcript_27775/g.67592  ORF Transcript_27775/g.67592 Transcript_27775/m.67592 type:complete len:211 (+) Transcript_27775:52-684(+)